MAAYSTSLDPQQQHIRRLILHPGHGKEPLSCTSETASLLDQPYYEALSYVWGDPSSQKDILFHGVIFPVTSNLAAALSHLRLPNKPRVLWIDALCINQSNTAERNEQVQLMGEIYKQASEVLIWLGQSDEQSDGAFDLLLGLQADSSRYLSEEHEMQLFEFYFELVKREWFSRLWTVQELVLAGKSPLVGCGLKWISWTILTETWQRVAHSKYEEMDGLMPSQNLNIQPDPSTETEAIARPTGIKLDLLNTLRQTSASDKGKGKDAGSQLQHLLLNTITSRATEPRDRIYALLGLLTEDDRRDISIVDYAAPLESVYASAIAHLFRKGCGPFFLSRVELCGSFESSSTQQSQQSQQSRSESALAGTITTPSWLPRFGSTTLIRPTRFHAPGIGASGAGSGAVNGVVDGDLKTLRVRGLFVDVVADRLCFGAGLEYLRQLGEVERMVADAKRRAELNRDQRPYLHPFKIREPVWRVLVANKRYSAATWEVAPAEYGQAYERLLLKDQNLNESGTGGDDSETTGAAEYKLNLGNYLPSSCFFVTETGFYGIANGSLRAGDHLAIWFGAPVPMAVRPAKLGHVPGETVYTAVGVAYVAGIMKGEMVDDVYCEDLEDDVVFTVR